MPVSIPDIPVACRGSVTPACAPYTGRSISTSSSIRSWNTGSRWPSGLGIARARQARRL